MNLIGPDEHGMAWLDLGGNPQSVKQVSGEVLYDLDEQSRVIGIEFLFAPTPWLIRTPDALIKGEQIDHLGEAIRATAWAYTEGEQPNPLIKGEK